MRSLMILVVAATCVSADDAMMGAIGKKAAGVFEEADRVEAYRVAPEVPEEPAKESVDGYPILKTGKALDAAFARRIAAELGGDATRYPSNSECTFQPRDAFRIRKGEERVEVLVCFHCEEVRVTCYREGKEPRRTLGEFEGGSRRWFALCRWAFEDDGDLRRLEAWKLGPTKKVREFLGKTGAGIIREASEVYVYRIAPEGGAEDRNIQGHRILADGPELETDARESLVGALFDEATYRFSSVKGCEFRPGVAFRFEGAERVEVLVCFSCDELEIVSFPKKAAGPRARIEDCDGARDALLRIAKASFPDDKDIQALPEKRAK